MSARANKQIDIFFYVIQIITRRIAAVHTKQPNTYSTFTFCKRWGNICWMLLVSMFWIALNTLAILWSVTRFCISFFNYIFLQINSYTWKCQIVIKYSVLWTVFVWSMRISWFIYLLVYTGTFNAPTYNANQLFDKRILTNLGFPFMALDFASPTIIRI